MVQSALWFAVMATLVKLAGERGLPTMQIVLARALITLTPLEDVVCTSPSPSQSVTLTPVRISTPAVFAAWM